MENKADLGTVEESSFGSQDQVGSLGPEKLGWTHLVTFGGFVQRVYLIGDQTEETYFFPR